MGQLVEDHKHIFSEGNVAAMSMHHVATPSLRSVPLFVNSQKAIKPEFNKLLI